MLLIIVIDIAIPIAIPIQTRSSLTRRFLLKLWKLAISSLIGIDLFGRHFEASIRVGLCLPFSLANCGFGMTCLDWLLPENECDCNWLVANSCALTTPSAGLALGTYIAKHLEPRRLIDELLQDGREAARGSKSTGMESRLCQSAFRCVRLGS